MGFVRQWWSPVVAGLVVAFLGIGVGEVTGLPARGAPAVETAAVQPVSPRTSVAPAAIEHDDRVVELRPGAATPRVTHRARVPKPTSTPRPQPTRTASPTRSKPMPSAAPGPRPTPTVVATPPRRTVPLVRLKPTPSPSPTTSTPTPAPTRTRAPTPKPKPVRLAQVLDLRAWKLTLPTGRQGHPTELRQPVLGALASGTYARLTPDHGVAFRAPVGGATTGNSSYPRSELREMSADGRHEAGWTNTAGRHVMTISQAITATPRVKPHVVAGQIHDADDDVVMIRLERRRLLVESDGDEVGLLDPAYRLGTRFTLAIVATPSGVRVTYDGKRIVDLPRVGRDWYFKAGCYPQSNPDRGDRPTAYGEVVIYDLTVRHS